MIKLNEQQQKEIETIRERSITIKLSDADCERLARKCGECGMAIAQLFENFVGDLVDGTYSNGSDERMHANEWFDRCWFAWTNKETLLRYLTEAEHDVEDFLIAYDEKGYYKEHPEEYEIEIEEEGGYENLWFNVEYREYTEEFIEKNPNADMEKEIEACRSWLEEFKKIKGE